MHTHLPYEEITCLSCKSHFETCSVQKQTPIIKVLRILIKDLFNMVIASDKSKGPHDQIVDDHNSASFISGALKRSPLKICYWYSGEVVSLIFKAPLSDKRLAYSTSQDQYVVQE